MERTKITVRMLMEPEDYDFIKGLMEKMISKANCPLERVELKDWWIMAHLALNLHMKEGMAYLKDEDGPKAIQLINEIIRLKDVLNSACSNVCEDKDLACLLTNLP